MIRKIIHINGEKCVGCGLCVDACQQGAIGMVNGKATLLRDDYCDGLGNCLPVCPTGAITFEKRESLPFDKAPVTEEMEALKPPAGGCPGSAASAIGQPPRKTPPTLTPGQTQSELRQWPVQIKLVSPAAPYFDGANLLIAADCAAYAYAGFHEEFMKDRITLIGCPKLDDGDYADKLTEILANNNIHSITCVRMEVPCCTGIERAVKTAIQNSGKRIPSQIITLKINGELKEE